MDTNSLAGWARGCQGFFVMFLCDAGGARRVAHTCRRLACVRLFPHGGPCRHWKSLADITRRRLRHPRQTWKAKVCATAGKFKRADEDTGATAMCNIARCVRIKLN